MNPITFPGLGLTFHIQRVAFSLFGKDVYWYGVIIAFGFLLGISFACSQAKANGVKDDDLLDMFFVATPLGIICARIYYVVFFRSLYLNPDGTMNWRDAIAIWDGGLAIYGGIIGGVLTALIFCLIRKQSFLGMADCAAYALLIGQSMGRWGNFVNQEAYGGPCTLPWRMALTVGGGQVIEVHPTFLYESLWNLTGLLLLFFVIRKRKKFQGQLFFSYLFWYGLGRFWIEGMRADSLYLFDTGLRVSQVVALVTLTIAAVVLLWNGRKSGKKSRKKK